MAEDSTPKPSQPRRHRPRLNELSRETTEDDLWDLDAEPEKPAAPPEPEPEEEPPADEVPAAPEASGSAARQGSPSPEPPPEATREVPDEEPEKVSEPAHAARTESPDTPGAEPESETTAARETARPVRREWMGLALLAAIVAGLAIWWISGLLRDIPTQRLGDDEPDFPVSGSHAVVAGAKTYWRPPVLAGDDRDGARSGVAFIPVIEVELSGGSGALRAIFRNEHGESVGDVITRSFQNGRFTRSGAPGIELPGTDGYESEADFSGYRVGTKRWTVEVLEGPSADAGGSGFQTLFTAPLSTERR